MSGRTTCLVEPVWSAGVLTDMTFQSVVDVLSLVSHDVVVDAPAAIIGMEGFVVQVASSCSGVEGFALITAFLTIYSILLGRQLYLVKFWAIVFPVALLSMLL